MHTSALGFLLKNIVFLWWNKRNELHLNRLLSAIKTKLSNKRIIKHKRH